MGKLILITTENTVRLVDCERGSKKFNSTVKEHIGDFYECVHPRLLEEPYVLLVDERGLCKDGFEINTAASFLYETHRHGSPIVGNVVVAKIAQTSEGMDLVPLDEGEAIELCVGFKELLSKLKHNEKTL